MSMLLACLPFALAAESLEAPPALSLAWGPDPGTQLTYELDTDIRFHADQQLQLVRPSGPSISHVTLQLRLDCLVQGSDPPVRLECGLHQVDLKAPDAPGSTAEALGGLASRLSQGGIELRLSDDGRLLDLDLFLPADPRADDAGARMLLSRAIAGLDLELPADPGSASWTQRRSAFVVTPSSDGPLGRADLQHTRLASAGTTAAVQTSGTVSHLVYDLALRPVDHGLAQVSSFATFDTDLGVMTERTWRIADTDQSPYAQFGRLRLIGVAPPLALSDTWR